MANRNSGSKGSQNRSSNNKTGNNRNASNRKLSGPKASGNQSTSNKMSKSMSGGSKSTNNKSSENKSSESKSSENKSSESKSGANKSGGNKSSDFNPSKYKKTDKSKSYEKRFVSMVKAVKVTETYKPFLVEPPCPVFEKCGGCQLQMYNEEGQLKYKFSKAVDLLGKFAKLDSIEAMERPFHYRHKTHSTFAFQRGNKSKLISGIYEENTHKVVEIDNCLIQDERANEITKTILSLMPSFKMHAYDEDRQTGFLRHVLIRTAYANDGVMVVLVGSKPIFPAKRNFVKALIERHPEITTVVFNINMRKTSMVLGDREEILYGDGYLIDSLCGKSFRISPKAFYQVNPEQTEKLYQKAVEYAGLTGSEIVLDAYSGIGTIGIIASDKAKEVISVELNKEAFKDAIKSAKMNQVDNIRFINADATEFIVGMAESGDKVDVVILDPPRSGSTPEFIKAVGKLKPKTVVYVSCSLETLSRDLEAFKRQGYKISKIKPFDMFPWTEHVECCCKLILKE